MENSREIARLQEKLERMRTLVEVNALISSSLDLDTILGNVMSISKKSDERRRVESHAHR